MMQEPMWLEEKRSASRRALASLPPPPSRKGLTIQLDLHHIMEGISLQSKLAGPPAARRLPSGKGVSSDCRSRMSVIQAPRHTLFRDAMPGQFARSHLFSLLRPQDAFLAWHCANARVQAIDVVGAGIERADAQIITVAEPTHFLIHALTGTRTTIIMMSGSPSNDKDAKATHPPSTSHLLTLGIELFLEKEAYLDLILVQDHPGVDGFQALCAMAAEKAGLRVTDLSVGGRTTIITSNVKLGKGAEYHHQSLFFPWRDEVVSSDLKATLIGPGARARIDGKGVVGPGGKAVIEGMIHCTHAAVDSSAVQDIDLLLYGEDAVGDAIPLLTIDTAEVQSTHEARVGGLDEDELFYLTSRGLTRQDAEELLIRAFFSKGLHGIPEAINRIFLNKITANLRR